MIDQFPYISLQRLGKVNPLSIDDFINTDGFLAIKKAFTFQPIELLEKVEQSGLRGRGGAGFPTGIKQRFASNSLSDQDVRFVICNADEGEPGTFKDRFIIETDPFLLIEGIMLAGYAIGAKYGYIYLRGEYHQSIKNMKNAIDSCCKNGYLGKNILGSGFSFDMKVFLGAGSYLCGEELTMIESLEGKRGYPRIKPPFPAEKGLWGLPTLINNVETFSHLPFIMNNGIEAYSKIGTAESKGTKLFCVSGNVVKTGVFELPMGVTLRELIFEISGGMKENLEFKGALLGGAAGTFVDATLLDVPLAYETLKAHQATMGSGAVIVIDNKTNIHEFLTSILSFFKHESCGKCVPCRIGTALLVDTIKKENLSEADLMWMQSEAEYIAKNSLCPLGQSPVLPIRSCINYFKNDILL
jgi:NADH-quinone oxidoreductase subunit F